MKGFVRNKIEFRGTPDQLVPLVSKLGGGEGQNALVFERIIPLEDKTPAAMEQAWGIRTQPEEMDYVLYRNQTILEYTFDTEESAPLPIFRALAERCADYEMAVLYASDDYGENCGWLKSPAGSAELKEEEPADRFEFACDVWGVDPEEELQERMINAYEE